MSKESKAWICFLVSFLLLHANVWFWFWYWCEIFPNRHVWWKGPMIFECGFLCVSNLIIAIVGLALHPKVNA